MSETNGYALALSPHDAEQAFKAAEWMAKSEMVPKQYQGKPHNIVIACAMGARLGLDPFSAMSGIAVVNGRPTLYGDAMLAVCQQRPDWQGMTVEWTGEGDTLNCTVTVQRKGQTAYPASFSVQDAKTAGLWKKQGPWSQYPRRMLEMRARAFALRSAFADALSGFHAAEEMEDMQEVEGRVVEDQQPAEPKPARTGKGNKKKPDPKPEPVKEPEPEQEEAPADTEPEETNEGSMIAELREEMTQAGSALMSEVNSVESGKGKEVITALLSVYGATKAAGIEDDDVPKMLADIRIARERLDYGDTIADIIASAEAAKDGEA